MNRTAGRFLGFVMLAALLAPDARAFNPATDISGNNCVLWLKADAGVKQTGDVPAVDGSSVTKWEDQSGKGNHAMPVSPWPQPIYRASVTAHAGTFAGPAVSFEHENQTLGYPSVNARTVFFVCVADAAANVNQGIVGSYTDPSDAGIRRNSSDAQSGWDQWPYSEILRVNGELMTSPTAPVAGAAEGLWHIGDGLRSVDPVYTFERVGAYYDGRALRGDVAEVIIYDRALSDPERNQVGYYLKQKYDITAATYTPPPVDASTLIIGAVGPFTYSGLAQTPLPTVHDGVTLLTKDTHYELSYANNINAGTATLTVTGIPAGGYTGTKNANFTIDRATATVVVTPYTVTYDGLPHSATVTSITGVNEQTGATVGTVTLNTTHTAAGTYAADTWSFTGTANYNDIAPTTIIDTISPLSLVLMAQAQTEVNTTLVGTAELEPGRPAGNPIFSITGGANQGLFEFSPTNPDQLHFVVAPTAVTAPNVFYYVEIQAKDDGDPVVGGRMLIKVQVISSAPPFTVFQFK